MVMNYIEQIYNTKILPKYGTNRNIINDTNLINNNNNFPKIDIDPIREEFTHPVFSIDPPKCTDADDAFSLYQENNNLYLVVITKKRFRSCFLQMSTTKEIHSI